MDKELVIPLNATIRAATYERSLCRTCKHIVAAWSFCKPRIVRSGYADGYNYVAECNGYERETKQN